MPPLHTRAEPGENPKPSEPLSLERGADIQGPLARVLVHREAGRGLQETG